MFLEIHHLTYENVYNEKLEDLATLCHDCHTMIHECSSNLRASANDLRDSERLYQEELDFWWPYESYDQMIFDELVRLFEKND